MQMLFLTEIAMIFFHVKYIMFKSVISNKLVIRTGDQPTSF